jgi:glycosyltransferase involved in cell wall biosynthesis
LSAPLTIVVPVLNEARNLPACLASIPAGTPVVVVDSGSDDATVAIARDAGAEVLTFRWSGGFPKKRSWTLQNHSFETPWVLFLDADERLTPEFLAQLPEALSRPDIVGYWLNYQNSFMGRTLRHGVPQRKLALMRVGAGQFERIDDDRWSGLDMEVHEHPILNGKVGQIGPALDHQDVRGLAKHIDRHNDYSTWEARRWAALKSQKDARAELTWRQRLKYRNLPRWWFAPTYFLAAYFLRGGFLDGRAGLAYAFLKYVYFAEIRLKILELRLGHDIGA